MLHKFMQYMTITILLNMTVFWGTNLQATMKVHFMFAFHQPTHQKLIEEVQKGGPHCVDVKNGTNDHYLASYDAYFNPNSFSFPFCTASHKPSADFLLTIKDGKQQNKILCSSVIHFYYDQGSNHRNWFLKRTVSARYQQYPICHNFSIYPSAAPGKTPKLVDNNMVYITYGTR